MPKIAIASAADKNYETYFSKNYELLKDYCDKQKNEYFYDKCPDSFDRPASWFKIRHLQNTMKNTSADYILWCDADTLIINKNINISSHFPSEPNNTTLFLTKDVNGINAGVFGIANNKKGQALLQAIWDTPYKANHPWWEQYTIMQMIKNKHSLIKDIEYLPSEVFNSYSNEYYPQHSGAQVSEDSLFLHLPGLPIKTRQEIFSKYINDT